MKCMESCSATERCSRVGLFHRRIRCFESSVRLLSMMSAAPTFMNPGCKSVQQRRLWNHTILGSEQPAHHYVSAQQGNGGLGSAPPEGVVQ